LPGASPPAGDPDGANLTAAHDPWELRRPCRPAVPGSAGRIRSSPPGPQHRCPPPWLQSCTSRARMALSQNPSREQSIASRRSASADGQRAEADTPTRLSPPPNPASRAGDTLGSTPLGCFLIRCSLAKIIPPHTHTHRTPTPCRDIACLELPGD
uniref:Uncharacterized protein n=1 Tax=Cricetulus griseus TaxID=10029 RepID=A0A8C2MGN4_CRIGR